ncbi:hypothetical protein PV328_010905 [Microctonus aethiopoides]|uniref:Chitin-binding type-2 domain-containing protein n=1 Tax=Microctonus aethiopoides TaxID=144406 RepID=A0AA39FJ11_9HYME|nr:hypothetical protein PV328_010905 [Microctonus aethiopoides]
MPGTWVFMLEHIEDIITVVIDKWSVKLSHASNKFQDNSLLSVKIIIQIIGYGVIGQFHQRSEFQCLEEGYHADPNNCQIYYRCVSWGNGDSLTKFKFECGPGTVFSHAKGDICVHPYESERSECNESGNDLDSNNYYPENNEESLPSYGMSPGSPNYEQYPQTSSSNQRPPTSPSYERPSQTSPSYGQTHTPMISSIPTESPSNNEIESSHLPSSPSSGAEADNIPHPIAITTVSPMPTRQSECQQEGFFANPNDCKKFFRCVDDGRGSYLKYDFTCGDGTVWDPTIEGCNHAWAVKRNDCSTSSQDPDDGDNNGNNGQGIDQSQTGGEDNSSNMTPKPSWQTETSQAPGYPSYPASQSPNGYPDSSVAPVSTMSPAYIPPCESTSAQPSMSSSTLSEIKPMMSTPPAFISSPSGSGVDNGNPPESTAKPPSASGESSSSSCSEEGFFGEPNDCMKFYRCVKGQNSLMKYEFTCGEGTAWDQSIQSCNHIYAVPSCSGKDNLNGQMTPTSDGDEMNSSSESNKNEENSTEGINQSQSSDMTTSSSSEASNENSSKPTENIAASMTSQSTPITEESSSIATSEPSSSPSTTTDSSEISTSQQETSSSSMPEQTSEADMIQQSSSSSMPDESSESTMPQQESSSTSSPGESTSQENSSSSTTMQSTASPESPEPPKESSTTSSSMSSDKPSESSDNSQCQDEGFFPNPTNCRKFYRCVSTGNDKFIQYSFDCAPGTAWDQSLLTCNYIDKVASCGSEMNEIPSSVDNNEQMTSIKPVIESMVTSTTKKAEQENAIGSSSSTVSSDVEKNTTPSSLSSTESNNVDENNNKSTTELSEKNTTQVTNGSGDCSTSKPSQNGIVCDAAGFYANPMHCDKFYRCVDNGNGFNVYHFDCPPGTIFDPSISVCNYPESVYPARNCGDGDKSDGESGSSKPSVSTDTPPAVTDASEETPTSTVASPGEGTEGSEATEISTEPTTESTGAEESSTETITESTGGEESSSESSTESTTGATETTSSGTEATGGEEVTTGTSEIQTTTGSQDSTMTTETSMSTDEVTDSSESTMVMTTETMAPESQTSTEAPVKTDVNNEMITPCPIGNLTDEQIVLVCPTGFRRHPKYCNMFYQCSNEDDMKIKILVLGCPEGTIYDEEKIQCKPESESSQPCNTQMASSRFYRQLDDTPVSPVRVRRDSLCPGEGHYPYQTGCSNAFYKCKKNKTNKLQGYLYKCPKDFVYWSVSRRCERANRMPVCSQNQYEDNEQMYSWDKRWELPVEESNLSARMLHF